MSYSFCQEGIATDSRWPLHKESNTSHRPFTLQPSQTRTIEGCQTDCHHAVDHLDAACNSLPQGPHASSASVHKRASFQQTNAAETSQPRPRAATADERLDIIAPVRRAFPSKGSAVSPSTGCNAKSPATVIDLHVLLPTHVDPVVVLAEA